MDRISRKIALVAIGSMLLAGGGGYVAGVQYTSAHHSTPASCRAPALAGPHGEPFAGYVASGSRIVGTNGGNGIAPGDVFTCVNGHSGVN